MAIIAESNNVLTRKEIFDLYNLNKEITRACGGLGIFTPKQAKLIEKIAILGFEVLSEAADEEELREAFSVAADVIENAVAAGPASHADDESS